MIFEYSHIMKLVGFNDEQITFFQKNTGYGILYHNYKLASQYLNSDYLKDEIIPINQCNSCLLDPKINNCFVIFQSDYLPKSFIQTINNQNGYILVNSQWMKNVVLEQAKVDLNRIIKIPYLQDFQKLNKYKKLNIKKDNNKLTFYSICDSKDVKNINVLFDAFDVAFKNQQDVELIIKTSNLDYLKQGLYINRKKFPLISIINTMLPEIEIYKLHLKGDIYISPALCVGWQIPPFQASYFGNLLICGNHSAYTEWVDFNNAIQLQSYKKIITLRQYSNGRFRNNHSSGWKINMIDEDQLIKKLKYVYNNYKELKQMKQDLSRFDIKNIDYWVQQNKLK